MEKEIDEIELLPFRVSRKTGSAKPVPTGWQVDQYGAPSESMLTRRDPSFISMSPCVVPDEGKSTGSTRRFGQRS